MNKSIENIDKYLKGVELPEHVSYQHQQLLRREILAKIERRRTMSVKAKSWKVAAVIAVVMGAGALATTVGLKIRKYYFAGKETDGAYSTYKFKTEPETIEHEDGTTEMHGTMVGITSMDPNFTINVEQKIKDLEEIDLLRQQDERELIRVTETEVNGELQPRTFGFKYVLSDGREETMGESDPDTQDRERSLTREQQDELLSLRLEQAGLHIGIEEKEVRGRVFLFERQRFVLSDGTEVIVSTGKPQ
ncbi:MAG: hypothetical protein AMJ65_08525 [Phycisphaerae bacterium SG8_4]|nr:MAG: hypothetical protein AMJ65_08525 [Phycisphaerae bacterium SG8_4]